EAGPNAVLALEREGYRAADVSLRDLADMARFPGFWRMCAQNWRTGLAEMYRSASASAFVQTLRKLVPAVERADVRYLRAGVRAPAARAGARRRARRAAGGGGRAGRGGAPAARARRWRARGRRPARAPRATSSGPGRPAGRRARVSRRADGAPHRQSSGRS